VAEVIEQQTNNFSTKIITMKHFILVLAFLFTSINIVSAQWPLVESIDAATITAQIGFPATYDVDAYRIEYPTTNIDGTAGMASGLLCVPKNDDTAFPMVVYQHGTVDSRVDVPSNLAGGYQLGQILAGLGYTVLLPDYLGLGINPGIHPYVHADSEAWVAIDMMREVKAKYSENLPERFMNDQVFITGYSQGGHAGMALHRAIELEHADEFTVTAASHMSGPYSISEKMIDFTLGDEEYGFSGYLASTSLSVKAAFPDLLADYEVEDIFKPQYVEHVNDFAAENITLFQLNAVLEAGLIADVGITTPKDLLLPGIVDALKNDPDHPLSQAMQMNDVYDWSPQAPTRLMYCSGDDQVTFENAILAEEVMLANGAADLEAIEQGAALDHGGCISPATIGTVFFFNDHRELLSSNGNVIEESLSQMKLSQLENSIYTIVDPAIVKMENPQIFISDMQGRNLIVNQINRDQFTLDVSSVSSGMYVISISGNGQLIETVKIFIK